jgi:hypothetical protein
MKSKQGIKKKVHWNKRTLVEVIYECYIPHSIRNSTSQMQRFTNNFDECSERYIHDIMKKEKFRMYISFSIECACIQA